MGVGGGGVGGSGESGALALTPSCPPDQTRFYLFGVLGVHVRHHFNKGFPSFQGILKAWTRRVVKALLGV